MRKILIISFLCLFAKTTAQVQKNDTASILLNEVEVKSSGKVIYRTNKTIYRINAKDFPVNANADMSLFVVPEIVYADNLLKTQDNKDVTIYIDGIPSSINDMKNMSVTEIDRVEYIHNPSAAYGSELKGVVLNVVRRRSLDSQLKGDLKSSVSTRETNWMLNPSLSYKNRFMVFNAYYSYLTNNQKTRSEIQQTLDGVHSSTQSEGKTKGWQENLASRMLLTFDKNNTLVLTGEMFKYDLRTRQEERLNGVAIPEYSTNYKYRLQTYNASYSSKLKDSRTLLVRFRLLDLDDTNEKVSETEEEKAKTDFTEFSGDVVYENKSLNVLGRNMELTMGLKDIYRTNRFAGHNVRQNVLSAYVNADYSLSSSLSGYLSLFAENTANTSSAISTSYFNLLPVASLMWSGNAGRISLNYSKKITRPSAMLMNPEVVYVNSLTSYVGNPSLTPQIVDNVELGYSRRIKQHDLSFTVYGTFGKDNIVRCATPDKDRILYGYQNIGTSSRLGGRMSWSTFLFKNKLYLRSSIGLGHETIHANTENTLLTRNQGWIMDASVMMMLMNVKGWTANFVSSFISRSYSLTETYRGNPFLQLSAQKNLFKNRLTLKITADDFLDVRANTKSWISTGSYTRNSMTCNHSMALNITLVVHLGKRFSDTIQDKAIVNDDVKTGIQ